MIPLLALKRYSKQTLTLKFLVSKNLKEVDHILHILLHEMGYRFVTGNKWEIAGPMAFGIYRLKWIPERFLDIHLSEVDESQTKVVLNLSYYLLRRRFKWKIDSILMNELYIIKDVLIHGNSDLNIRDEMIISSLKAAKESNNFLIFLVLAFITGLLVLLLISIPDSIQWLYIGIFLFIQFVLLYWFHTQNKQ